MAYADPMMLRDDPVDKQPLQDLYDDALKLEKEVYTTDTWKHLQSEMTEMQDVLQNSEVDQNMVESAFTRLQQAIDNFDTGIEDWRQQLEQALATMSVLEEENYTVENWKTLDITVEYGKNLLTFPDEEVSDDDMHYATQAIWSAYVLLEPASGSRLEPEPTSEPELTSEPGLTSEPDGTDPSSSIAESVPITSDNHESLDLSGMVNVGSTSSSHPSTGDQGVSQIGLLSIALMSLLGASALVIKKKSSQDK